MVSDRLEACSTHGSGSISRPGAASAPTPSPQRKALPPTGASSRSRSWTTCLSTAGLESGTGILPVVSDRLEACSTGGTFPTSARASRRGSSSLRMLGLEPAAGRRGRRSDCLVRQGDPRLSRAGRTSSRPWPTPARNSAAPEIRGLRKRVEQASSLSETTGKMPVPLSSAAGKVHWLAYQSPTGHINMKGLFGTPDHALAYAACSLPLRRRAAGRAGGRPRRCVQGLDQPPTGRRRQGRERARARIAGGSRGPQGGMERGARQERTPSRGVETGFQPVRNHRQDACATGHHA